MKINSFNKTYDGRTVLKMPAVELEKGKLYAVIGANGSGKSTLAKILAGLETADGKIAVLPKLKTAYMPQKSYGFRMSVRKNILLNGGGWEKAEELMKALKIDHLADKPAHKLSGGETARMALARLMMGSYDLVILDEPTASMDMESTALAEGLIRDYCRERGCTLLLVTHSLQQARRIADAALFLHKGELEEWGGKDTVLYSPNNQNTRDFLRFYGA